MNTFLLACLLATSAVAQNLTEERIEQLTEIQGRYTMAQASAARLNHLFCLERTTSDEGEVKFTEFEQQGMYVWTLFFQYPVISYLDPQRKLSLMDTVMNILDNGNTVNSTCIGTYETYELSYFRESILIHVYGRDMNLDAEAWATRFNTRVVQIADNENIGYAIRYPGQNDVIALNISTSNYYNNLLQPNSETNEGVDLTVLPVFIGSYDFNYTFTDSTNSTVSLNIDGQPRRSFADNTNPINYGLEPGDIVFAVFGSLVLIIVSGMIILGYCIHPFFLA